MSSGWWLLTALWCGYARFSLEQSQTWGDRLGTRLEAAMLELHSRPALQSQASEEGGLAQSVEEGTEGNPSSAAERGVAVAEDKSEEVCKIWGEGLGFQCNREALGLGSRLLTQCHPFSEPKLHSRPVHICPLGLTLIQVYVRRFRWF